MGSAQEKVHFPFESTATPPISGLFFIVGIICGSSMWKVLENCCAETVNLLFKSFILLILHLMGVFKQLQCDDRLLFETIFSFFL